VAMVRHGLQILYIMIFKVSTGYGSVPIIITEMIELTKFFVQYKHTSII
jgi:hypothetical protein